MQKHRRKFFETAHCPLDDRANKRHKIKPDWPYWLHELSCGSKGQFSISKLFSSLLLPSLLEKKKFFSGAHFSVSMYLKP